MKTTCFREEASRYFLVQRNLRITVNLYYTKRSIKSASKPVKRLYFPSLMLSLLPKDITNKNLIMRIMKIQRFRNFHRLYHPLGMERCRARLRPRTRKIPRDVIHLGDGMNLTKFYDATIDG